MEGMGEREGGAETFRGNVFVAIFFGATGGGGAEGGGDAMMEIGAEGTTVGLSILLDR